MQRLAILFKIIAPFIVVIISGLVLTNLLGIYFQNNYLGKNKSFAELRKEKNGLVSPTRVEGGHKIAEWSGKRDFKQAPEFDKLVEDGVLPPVGERLPTNPLVIIPPEQCGPYGGRLYRAGSGPSDIEAGVIYLMNEGLIKQSPDAQEQWLNLASSFKILEEGMVYKLTLRKGLRWSDGEPFTTHDIEFWYKHILHNKKLTPIINTRMKSPNGMNFTLEIEDERNLTFRFPDPAPEFMTILGKPLPWLGNYTTPAHYLKQFHVDFADKVKLKEMVEKDGLSDWSSLFLAKNKYYMNTELPSMRGWIVKTPLPSSPSRFVRNPYYWKVDPEGNQLPYLDEIIVSVMDASATTLAAQYGKLDFQSRGISRNSRTLLLENQEKRGYRLSRSLLASSFGGINFNLTAPDKFKAELFRKPEFKQAMSMAINRDALVDAFTSGVGDYHQTSFLKSSPYYRKEDAKAYTQFNPQRANELLDEIGLTTRDSEGFRCRPDGSQLVMYLEQPSVSMKGTQASPLLMICRYWQQEVGMNVKYKAEARGLFYARTSAGIYDVMWGGSNRVDLLGASMNSLTPGQNRWCPKWNNYIASDGKSGEKPPPLAMRMITLRKEFEVEINPKKRLKILHELLDINRENLWVMCSISGPSSLYVVGDRMRNVPQVIYNTTALAMESFVKLPKDGEIVK